MLRHIPNFFALLLILSLAPWLLAVLEILFGPLFVKVLIFGVFVPLAFLPLYGELVSNKRIEKLDSLASIQRVYFFALGAGNSRSFAVYKLEELEKKERDRGRLDAIAKFARRMIKLQMWRSRYKTKEKSWGSENVSRFLPVLAAAQPAWEATLLARVARIIQSEEM